MSLRLETLLIGCLAAFAASGATLTVAEQNAIVQKYCVACHTDANPIGGISFQKFDAARPDPSVAAMMLSKMQDGAFGAAGLRIEPALEKDIIAAFSDHITGADRWTVAPVQESLLRASIVQQVPPVARKGGPSLYRLELTCTKDTHQGETRLTWAPADVPRTGAALVVQEDGRAPSTYAVEQGKGMANLDFSLPSETLTVAGLFTGEKVVFPFSGLPESIRQEFSACFARNGQKH